MDKVFVVHGRDTRLSQALFDFLRSIGVQPLEWTQAVALSEHSAPYIGDVLDRALSDVKAVVVLMTGDDIARLSDNLITSNDPDYERVPTPQARPNVLFEAGMAFGRHPTKTILVEIGNVRPFSDIAGRHVVRLDNSSQKRQELALRLRTANCNVDLSGTNWHTVGDFSTVQVTAPAAINKKPITLGSIRLDNVYLMFGNHTAPLHVETQYQNTEILLPDEVSDVYSFLAEQAKIRAEAVGVQYFNGPNTRLIRFSETSKQDTSGYEHKGIKFHLGPVSWEQYTVLNTNLDHVLRTGRTIRENYASIELLFANDRDLRWCRLSNILCVGMIPITSDGYGLIQERNPKGVSTEGNRYTSGIAENIHRYLDEVDLSNSDVRLHSLALPADLVDMGIDYTYQPATGRTLNPYLTASRGLWEEVSEKLYRMVPLSAYKFLNLSFELEKFVPVLVGIVELGMPLKEVEQIILESPGKDHSEFLTITGVRLDPSNSVTHDILTRDWVQGGLSAFLSSVHYWQSCNSTHA